MSSTNEPLLEREKKNKQAPNDFQATDSENVETDIEFNKSMLRTELGREIETLSIDLGVYQTTPFQPGAIEDAKNKQKAKTTTKSAP